MSSSTDKRLTSETIFLQQSLHDRVTEGISSTIKIYLSKTIHVILFEILRFDGVRPELVVMRKWVECTKIH